MNAHTQFRVLSLQQRQSGFTLLEVLFSMVILTIGLVGVLSLFINALAAMQSTQEDLLARQKAQQALESIYTARNTQQVTFDQIQNASNGGIFLDNFQTLNLAGADGLVGTADDGPAETLVTPGNDGLLGTGDDVITPLTNFQRRIQVGPVFRTDGSLNPDLRQVTISVQYWTPQSKTRNYSVGSYISRYR